MPDAHANFAYSTVATAPSPAASGTSLVVAAGHGSRFPAVPFNAVIWPTGVQPLPTNAEIVRVTAIGTDTLTITREQESTTARTVVVGDQIMAAITKKSLTDVALSMEEVGGASAYAVTAADCGKVIKQTGNSAANLAVTVAATAATLGEGFHFYIDHAGGGSTAANKELVFTPTTSTVDGQSSITDYPGVLRLIRSNGTNWETELLRGGYVEVAYADSPYSLKHPSGFTLAKADAWGAGGSGAGGQGNAAGNARMGGGGGGGGKRTARLLTATEMPLGSTTTCTIGAGATGANGGSSGFGTDGTAGGNTTFGTSLTAYGGGGGDGGAGGNTGGGGGGGATAAGATGTSGGSVGGAAFASGGAAGASTATDAGGGGGAAATAGGSSWSGGGGGGGGSASGATAGAGGSSGESAAAGGGGGGVNASNTQSGGGAGGDTGIGTVTTSGGGGSGGPAGGTNGTNGTTPTDLSLGGKGGGGGGGNSGGTGGTGGNGGVPGGGGGGGGGGTTVGGNGGNGGNGAIRFWYWP